MKKAITTLSMLILGSLCGSNLSYAHEAISCPYESRDYSLLQSRDDTYVTIPVTRKDVGIGKKVVYLRLGKGKRFNVLAICADKKGLYVLMTEKRYNKLLKMYGHKTQKKGVITSDFEFPFIHE